jgi:ribosomal-protein-alanine N-acetyltransferase
MSIAEAETPRLICRRPRGRDARHYRRLFVDELVAARLFPPPLARYTPKDAVRLLRSDIDHWNRHGFGPWVLVDRETRDFVGRGGLSWTVVTGRRAVELPWAITPERWGQGLATEAGQAALATARELSLNEVVSFALASNHASLRVMEKVGLERAGPIQHAGLPHVLYRAATGSGRPRR